MNTLYSIIKIIHKKQLQNLIQIIFFIIEKIKNISIEFNKKGKRQRKLRHSL